MRIRIVDTPVVCGGTSKADSYRKSMMAVAGMTLEVDTRYLFEHSFTVKPIPGVTKFSLSVMENNVAEVMDDERPDWKLVRKVREL